ncbi:hypothetical protein BDM02DRAFT_531615 [Thelephora ganbajun]|uniref:Uncharacterized protein n=1 Tax=Thelephora ganbajun TaxID=370292 RepID=A0ACB6ZQN3_THEGA|nr:hypothetical protein BDM02DRAFT_531615 [Thelephora ganbajun]
MNRYSPMVYVVWSRLYLDLDYSGQVCDKVSIVGAAFVLIVGLVVASTWNQSGKSKLSLNYTCTITLNVDIELVYFALSLFCGIRCDNRLCPPFNTSLTWTPNEPPVARDMHCHSGRNAVFWCHVHLTIHLDDVPSICKGWSENNPRTRAHCIASYSSLTIGVVTQEVDRHPVH